MRPFHASKSICPPCSSFYPTVKPLVRPECLDLTQSSLVLPLYVHHSLSLALGACLDTGHDRGYTQPHPHTVINTLYTTVLQVHQLASNNDLIPPGVRARRSRTAATFALLSDNFKYEPDKERMMTTSRKRDGLLYYSYQWVQDQEKT